MTDYGYACVSVGNADNNTLANQRLVLSHVCGVLEENPYTDIASGRELNQRIVLASQLVERL